jgi:hypothetical protein
MHTKTINNMNNRELYKENATPLPVHKYQAADNTIVRADKT